MRTILLLAVMLLASCTPKQLNQPPLGYSFMPPEMDLDSIGPTMPDGPSPVVDSGLQDYVSIQVDSAYEYSSSRPVRLPMGTLISEKKAALYTFYRDEYQRLTVQLKYQKYLAHEYYTKSLAAEKIYQKEILKLEDKAKRSWLEQNLGYIGFLCGVMSAVLTELAIVKIAD